ncbi:hypothetical protein PUV54_10920 [Hyphococcus flavus]|uniref:Transmembrane protein n=1 Tax=Hyphococcus flavus TaxID=1866326 RepID=A0AAE9ZAB2_9PROT|nr:hypothetical protein [Hyphococcus flavus]WDI30469.1 hypothetical protein PUV54_10920 [Hyphococcus flavus]
MKALRNTRNALLAAVSVGAASTALQPALAADFDGAVSPAIVEVQSTEPVPAPKTDQHVPIGAKKWALLVAAAGSLAWLLKLMGPKRVAKAVSEGAATAARATANTAAGAAKIVGRTVASPLRFLAVLFGLALFVLTGVGLYDIEWIGGLLSGAAVAGAGLYGYFKTRKVFQPIKIRRSQVKENRN